MNAKLLLWWPLCVAAVEGLSAILLNTASRKAPLAENLTFQALGSGIYWMVTVNVVVWMVAPLVAVTVRG
jgi:hypothetical protein